MWILLVLCVEFSNSDTDFLIVNFEGEKSFSREKNQDNICLPFHCANEPLNHPAAVCLANK